MLRRSGHRVGFVTVTFQYQSKGDSNASDGFLSV
jgi:hypothetical protein